MLCSCGNSTESSSQVESSSKVVTSSAISEEINEFKPITFTDDNGREVIINKKPQRVAVLIGSFSDVWCLAGGKDTLVAAAGDTWTQFDLNLSEDVVNLGSVKEPNIEALLGAEPDFVIGSTKTAADVAMTEMLDEMNIPSALFNVSSFDDYLRMLKICTDITGDSDSYQKYGTAIQSQVDKAKSRKSDKAPTVLYIRASGSSCKVKNSQNSVLGEMLADMGCINIADSETGLLEELSMETIIAQDPDYIFAVLQGSDISKPQANLEKALLSDPAWESLTAVKEGHFHLMDQKLFNLKPNAKWGESYEILADILYPEEN